ncbi:MAG: 2-phospho-L-lactate guanylyltransferase [Sphingomonadaceae bacterium]|nr:2-phospho-L-lactate guanylyltransferase [Sphingomonadaceae bacterium]
MTCWAIIPIKAGADAKSRLAGVLDAPEREALVRAMLAHVVSAAQASRMISRICLVGPSRLGMPEDIPLLADPGNGLNPAVQSAFAQVALEGPSRVIIIAADLPAVTPQELDLLAAPPASTIAIAPDRHETGTNAISLPLPAARDFIFAFGEDSFAKHKAEAEKHGLKAEIIFGHGLERDVDEPEHLPDAKAALGKE